MNYTQEEIQLAREWKELAEEYGLSLTEMIELIYHYNRVQELIIKPIDKDLYQ